MSLALLLVRLVGETGKENAMMHSLRKTVIILGGGYAGLAAASRLAENPMFAVTVVDRSEHFHERIRFHEIAAGRPYRSFAYRDMLEPRGILFRQATVESLDPERNHVELATTDGTKASLDADYIVYALGSTIDPDAIPGLAAYGSTLADFGAALAVHTKLQALDAPRIVVGGGGLTALELSTELAEARADAKVTLVPGNGLLPSNRPGGFHPKAIGHIRVTLERLGIEVLDCSYVGAVEAGLALTIDGQSLPFDLYLHASGFCIPDLARRSGIATDEDGRILTDWSLRSVSHPAIFAIGDAALARTADCNPSRLSCSAAMPMGTAVARILADVASGKRPQAHVTGYAFRNVSLGRNNGVIQFLDNEDRPLADVWTGSKAAKWKDYISRTGLHTVRFADEPERPAMPPIRLLPHLMQHAKKIA
jgi:NADH dehydrogenase FAD-containing subunit